jgi:hypothetical protein
MCIAYLVSKPYISAMRPAQSARRAQSAPCLHRPSHSIVPDVKHSNRRPQTTIRYSLDSIPGHRLARRHVREAGDRIGLRFGLRPERHIRPHHRIDIRHAGTALRQSVVDASEPHPVRPFSLVRTTTIDHHNGQAYHGRETTTNETRPETLCQRSCEGGGKRPHRCRRVASRVRSRLGQAGGTRVLRARSEAAIANDSMRCRR